MNRQALTAVVIAAAVVVVALLVYFLYPTASVPPEEGGAPPATEAERGDEARDLIARLQEEGQPNYDEAYARAEEFKSEGRLADAQLLLFFAARNGHAESAFELATAYDPNHHSPEASLLPEPDPFQAYKWYTQAAEGGIEAASQRLEALRSWAEKEAQSGNVRAEQLLLQWD